VSQERKSILIIDDDESLCLLLTDRLRAEGYNVDAAGDGIEGIVKSRRQTYDLIILDQMLPGRNGWDVCRDLRQDGIKTPIVFLTARRETADKITGLQLGADDYVTKPFCAEELMARIEVQLRRAPARKHHGVHQFGPFQVDLASAQVTRDGRVVHLARREFQLLRYLLERSGTNVSRAELLQAVWGYATTNTRTLDVHICNLREKLESNPRHPELILTVGGLGYKVAGGRNGKALECE
jgi:DNA-binding response OmpR family regulator